MSFYISILIINWTIHDPLNRITLILFSNSRQFKIKLSYLLAILSVRETQEKNGFQLYLMGYISIKLIFTMVNNPFSDIDNINQDFKRFLQHYLHMLQSFLISCSLV